MIMEFSTVFLKEAETSHKKNMRSVLMTISIIPLFYSLNSFLEYIITEEDNTIEELIRICRNCWKHTEFDFSKYSFAKFDDDDENGNDKYQVVFDKHISSETTVV